MFVDVPLNKGHSHAGRASPPCVDKSRGIIRNQSDGELTGTLENI